MRCAWIDVRERFGLHPLSFAAQSPTSSVALSHRLVDRQLAALREADRELDATLAADELVVTDAGEAPWAWRAA